MIAGNNVSHFGLMVEEYYLRFISRSTPDGGWKAIEPMALRNQLMLRLQQCGLSRDKRKMYLFMVIRENPDLVSFPELLRKNGRNLGFNSESMSGGL